MPGDFEELVDFETPDGQRRLMRRAEAERFAQEGAGTVVERNVPTQLEAQGPTEDEAFEVPSLPEVQAANPTPEAPGPGGFIRSSADGPPDLLDVNDSFPPLNPPQAEAAATPQPSDVGPGGLILSSLNTPVEELQLPVGTDPIDADDGPQTFEEQLELSRQNVAAGIAPSRLNPETGEPQPAVTPQQAVQARPQRAQRPRSRATGPVAPSRAEQLSFNFNEAEEKVVRSQQAAALLQAQGFEDEANAIMQNVADTEAFVNQRREALEEDRRENEVARVAREQRVAELESQIAETDISDNRSLGQRLLGGLMIGLFQAGSTIAGAPGTPNAALQIIQSAIKRDINLQKSALGKLQGQLRAEKNELGQLADAMGSLEAAETKLEEIRLGQAKNKLAALAARSQSAVVKQNAQAMDSQLELTRAQRQADAEVARQQAEAKIAADRRNRAFQRQQQREKQAFELKKIGLKSALEKDKLQAQVGEKITGEVIKLEQEFHERGIAASKRIGSEMLRLSGANNPQDLMDQIGSKLFWQRLRDSDANRADALATQLELMATDQLIKGVATEADQARIKAAMGRRFRDDPSVFREAVRDFLVNTQTQEASLFAGARPESVQIFRSRFQKGAEQVARNPQTRKINTSAPQRPGR